MRDKTENGSVRIPKDSNEWPDSWFSHEQKSYNFLNPIFLLKHNKEETVLSLLQKRSSDITKVYKNKITLENISYVLRCGYSNIGFSEVTKLKRKLWHRTVPSGGARYSCEIYIYIFKKSEDLDIGIYHYNPDLDLLERVRINLDSFPPMPDDLKEVNGLICINSVFDRVTRKYGSRGYRLALLESGHISQNMIIGGLEKDFYFRPVAALNEKKIEDYTGINSELESILYTMLF